MKKILIIGILTALLTGHGFAQNRPRFRSTEWLGLSTGQLSGAGLIRTVNGVAWGPWFAGLGAGVDYYRYRSIPLFVSVTRDIKLGQHDGLYLYADGGRSVPWEWSGSRIEDGYTVGNFRGGEYWAGGVGYLWKLGDRTNKALLLSAGYAEKKLGNDKMSLAPCVAPGCSVVRYEYLNQVYQFMIGFRF